MGTCATSLLRQWNKLRERNGQVLHDGRPSWVRLNQDNLDLFPIPGNGTNIVGIAVFCVRTDVLRADKRINKSTCPIIVHSMVLVVVLDMVFVMVSVMVLVAIVAWHLHHDQAYDSALHIREDNFARIRRSDKVRSTVIIFEAIILFVGAKDLPRFLRINLKAAPEFSSLIMGWIARYMTAVILPWRF